MSYEKRQRETGSKPQLTSILYKELANNEDAKDKLKKRGKERTKHLARKHWSHLGGKNPTCGRKEKGNLTPNRRERPTSIMCPVQKKAKAISTPHLLVELGRRPQRRGGPVLQRRRDRERHKLVRHADRVRQRRGGNRPANLPPR